MKLWKPIIMGFLLSLALAGCKEGQPSELVGKVQVIAKQTCGFIPTADFAARIIDATANTGGAAVAAVQAGKIICSMVTTDKVQTFFGWGDAKSVSGCWAIDPNCQPDGTLKG